jgi:hypothetical protein
VHVGDRCAFLQRVADAGPEHDHGCPGGASSDEQAPEIELLQDGLPMRPGDGSR